MSEKLKSIWENSIFVLDTSVLLDFYFYSEPLKQKIFSSLFEDLSGNLFIPHQVYEEYLKNREKVYKKPIQYYNDLNKVSNTNKNSGFIQKISKSITEIEGIVKTFNEYTSNEKKHPFLTNDINQRIDLLVSDFKSGFGIFTDKMNDEVNSKIDSLKMDLEQDEIHKVIEEKFKIGPEYDYAKLTQIAKDGEFRFRNKIAPGYEDQDKEGFRKYGDLIMWLQSLDFVKTENKNLILIINDVKRDWWEYDGKRNLKNPKAELIKELKYSANSKLLMYTMDDFLFHSKTYLDSQIESDEINEVSRVRKEANKEQNRISIENKIQKYFDISFNPIIDNSFSLTNTELSKSGNQIKTYIKNLENPFRQLFDTIEIKEIGENGRNTFLISRELSSSDYGKVEQILNDLIQILGIDDQGNSLSTDEDKSYFSSKDFNLLFGRRWMDFDIHPIICDLSLRDKKLRFGIWGTNKFTN